MAGSEESPELTSSLAKHEERWEGAEPPPDVVPLILAGTVGLFFIFPAASILRSSLKRAGDISADERALRKASAFCLSIMLGRCAVLVIEYCCYLSMCTSRHQYRTRIQSNYQPSVLTDNQPHTIPANDQQPVCSPPSGRILKPT
jgi:hypothetical protein